MGNLLGGAASEADPQSPQNLEKDAEEQEKVNKAEALTKLKETQAASLSTARARAAAGGSSGSSLADYFTSAEKMFDKENQWLATSNVRSSVVSEHERYYESASKQKGFGFLATGEKDWWA